MMSTSRLFGLMVATILVGLALLVSPAMAEKRVAPVIGNGAYDQDTEKPGTGDQSVVMPPPSSCGHDVDSLNWGSVIVTNGMSSG